MAVLCLFVFILTLNCALSERRTRRAIGGESLDTSNYVLFTDEDTGIRYIEVPYEYMQQWLDDQRMWRTVVLQTVIQLFASF